MKLAIITHVQHIKHNHQYYGYSPYVREMNIIYICFFISKELFFIKKY